MGDLNDLRRCAAQQAGTGNYWAGKCVGLIDRLSALSGNVAPVDRHGRTVAHLIADYERNGVAWEGCSDPACPDWALSDGHWFTHHHPEQET